MHINDKNGVFSPLYGQSEPLCKVSDEMFREEMLGPTICILPDDDMIYAPFDGTISVMYPSAHAVGIVRDDGLEVLIHIGIDTVHLNGEGFYSQVKQGNRVKKNSPLLRFDARLIQAKGYSLQTFIVFLNSQLFRIENVNSNKQIKIKDVLCYAEKL